MTVVYLVILLPIAAWATYLTIRGFGAPPTDNFVPLLTIEKSFAQGTSQVHAAYSSAARATPGMSIAEENDDLIVVDSRPTMRIMNGDFGSVLRITVTAAGSGTRLQMDYAPKTATAFVRNHPAAFAEKERALRMRAKQLGALTESG